MVPRVTAILASVTEYDLVCDGCGRSIEVEDAVVSWSDSAEGERAFALTHAACVPAGASGRADVHRLVWPNGYLEFVAERVGHRIADPESLRVVLWALAPFVMRHDNPTEMDSMRAESFGQRLGVKPGSPPGDAAPPKQTEGGK